MVSPLALYSSHVGVDMLHVPLRVPTCQDSHAEVEELQAVAEGAD